MSSTLELLFRHNLWANQRLLDRCAELTDAELELSAPGTYGKVRNTLLHLVGAEQRYVAALIGTARPPSLESAPFPGFPALRGLASQSGETLIRMATPDPAGTILTVTRPGETMRIDAAHFLLQAINHATEHRQHVVSILNQNGIDTPQMDGWAYSEDFGLIRPG